jgi:hypothetical protein
MDTDRRIPCNQESSPARSTLGVWSGKDGSTLGDRLPWVSALTSGLVPLELSEQLRGLFHWAEMNVKGYHPHPHHIRPAYDSDHSLHPSPGLPSSLVPLSQTTRRLRARAGSGRHLPYQQTRDIVIAVGMRLVHRGVISFTSGEAISNAVTCTRQVKYRERESC